MPRPIEVVETKGRRKANPVDSTKKCDDCKHTEEVLLYKSFGPFDTHQDARNAWATNPAIQAAIRLELIKAAWKRAWLTFNCTGDRCPIKRACNNKPIWWSIAIVLAPVGGGANPLFKFHFAIKLQREIECVKGNRQGPDVPPVAELQDAGLEPPGSNPGSEDSPDSEESSFDDDAPMDSVWIEDDGTMVIEKA